MSDATGMRYPAPECWRASLGFVLAPLAAAAAMSAVLGLLGGWSLDSLATTPGLALFGAYPTAAIVGLPTYAVMRGRFRANFWTALVVGGFVASGLWIVAGIVTAFVSLTHGLATHVDLGGVVADLAPSILLMGLLFLVGAFGGLVFWLCAVWLDPRFRPQTGRRAP